MNWKNYFYFQKGDKTAIILLLILISISGIFYWVTRPQKQTDTDGKNQEQALLFEQFQKGLKEAEYTEYKDSNTRNNSYKYTPRLQKLKHGETIELNSADTTTLKTIPGIGSGFANRIVKYRNSLGGFCNMNQLTEVWGMDEYLFNDIAPYIELEVKVTKIKVNSANFRELNRHPYINYKQAQAITDIRLRKGSIESIKRLALLDEFPEKDILRLTPYLEFD